MTRRSLAAVMLVSLLCVATQCHVPVLFQVQGDIDSGVTFRIFEFEHEDRTLPVEEIVVGESGGDEIWRLQGRAVIREFAYGQPVEGLVAQIVPMPLERGKSYYVVVLAAEQGWRRRAYYGTFSFAVDQQGRIADVPFPVFNLDD